MRAGMNAKSRILVAVAAALFSGASIGAAGPQLARDSAGSQSVGILERDVAVPVIQRQLAPAGAPNIVVVLLDDIGFGASATFGGPVATPALDALAQDGLRFNRFHTTAICSPTRAALLTGRNAHAAGVGQVINSATNYPGYRGVLSDETATIARVLGQNGYATSAWGKWHLVPDWEASQAGPFTRWPTGAGFDKFYGFLGGETDQYEPTLYDGTTPVVQERASGYHVTEDLADQAIAWMHMQRSVDPARPFFVYFAPGAAHAPLQPPAEWIARYHGKFDQGWDRLREQSFARQKAAGVIPANAVLTPRPEALPAWDSLTPGQQRTAARLMELFAAFLEHTDVQVGRLASALKDMGQYENTLFVYIVGDNGGSGEGGLFGSTNYMGDLQGLVSDLRDFEDKPGELLGENSYAHYPAGWAWGTNTPFQWTKQVASHLGGTRNPMVLSWPERIRGKGGLRQQFAHVNDIVPTILEVTGIAAPAQVDGVPQRPMDGVSLAYTFDDAAAAERHRTQYFSIYNNRAIYHDGWIASAFRGRVPWNLINQPRDEDFGADRWELYNLEEDFSQARDIAAQHPERLRDMQALFYAQAAVNQVLPLHNDSARTQQPPNLSAGRNRFNYRPGTIGVPEKEAPNTKGGHVLEARITVPDGGAQGVIATLGGRSAGWSLYLDPQGHPVYALRLFDSEEMILRGPAPLAAGDAVLRYEFATTGKGPVSGGKTRLLVNGKEVARGQITRSTVFYSIDETFDIGLDTGSSPAAYRAPYPFSGKIERVDIVLAP